MRSQNLATETRLGQESATRLVIEQELQWRTLSSEQQQKLSAAIPVSIIGTMVTLESISGDAEGQTYAAQFCDPLSKAGWGIPATNNACGSVGIFVGTLPEGIQVIVADKHSAPAGANLLVMILTQAGLSPVVALDPGMNKNELKLLIGIKPRPRAPQNR